MATVTRRCKGCEKRFRISNQSRRLWCEVCRPPRVKPLVPEVVGPVGAVVVPPGEVESALRVVLEAAERTDRYQAVLALRLARQLDSATSVAGAQGLASQIESLMTKALDGVRAEPDWVDEMAARRASVTARDAG